MQKGIIARMVSRMEAGIDVPKAIASLLLQSSQFWHFLEVLGSGQVDGEGEGSGEDRKGSSEEEDEREGGFMDELGRWLPELGTTMSEEE